MGEGVLTPQTRVLVGSQSVVGKQVQLADVGQRFCEPRDGGDLFRRIVEAGDHGHADDQVARVLGDPAGVVQNLLVGLTRVLLVLGGVHVLDVHHDVVDVGDQTGHHVSLGKGRGLDGGVEAPIVAGAEDGLGELGLGHSLTARQGDATPRTAVVYLVLDELLHEIADRNVLTHRLGGAVHGQLLEFVLLGLGIAAPAAPQVAPLQKHDRPNARPVVDGEALNIKNPTNAVVVICHVNVLSGVGERQGTACRASSAAPAKTLFAKRVLESQKP